MSDTIFDRLWDRISNRIEPKQVFSDESLKKLNEKETKKAENPILNAIDELFEAYEKFQNTPITKKGEEDMSIKVKDLDEMRKEAEEMSNKLSKEIEEQNKNAVDVTDVDLVKLRNELDKQNMNAIKEATQMQSENIGCTVESNKKEVTQAAPWVSYVYKLKALFCQDPDIRLDYDTDMTEVKLYINGRDKYEALDYLLPKRKVFGNVTLHISIIPSNEMSGGWNMGKMLRDAFKDNPIFSRTVDAKTMFDDVTYVMFHKEVAQYFDDNLADLNGVRSALYQDIADEVFRDMLGDKMRVQEMHSVHFCTEVE